MVFVLILAITMDILPQNEFTATIEAADVGTGFKIGYVDQATSGLVLINDGAKVNYMGLLTAMELNVVRVDSNGNPTVVEPGTKFLWGSGYPNSITLGGDAGYNTPGDAIYNADEKTKVYAYKKGPGLSNITCTITLPNNQGKLELHIVIKIPLNINKSANRNVGDGDPFKLLVSNRPELDNTALMFFEGTDTASSKEITLTDTTKPTRQTVTWISSIPEVAPSPRLEDQADGTVKVFIDARKAGMTKITGTANASQESDSFYAIVTPTFTESDGTNPTKTFGTLAAPKIRTGGDYLYTNAVDASTLTWKVFRIDNGVQVDAKDTLTLEPQKDGKCYINENPRAGLYRVTVQTKPEGMEMDPNLGIAEAYIKIPLRFMDDDSVVMSVGDSYDIFRNTTVQNVSDLIIDIKPADMYNSTSNPGGKIDFKSDTCTIIGKNNGIAEVGIRLKPDVAARTYGITDPTSQEYKDFVNPGKKISFSVMDIFGINTAAMTIKLREVRKLVATTNSPAPVSWVSSNSSIVKITSTYQNTCEITAEGVGVATISVSQVVNGLTRNAQCVVTVTKAADGLAIDPPIVKLNVDQTQTIMAKFTPADRVSNLSWKSSNDKVVKIESSNNESAIIRGAGSGTAVITVLSLDNNIIATCDVTVYGKITELKVLPESATVRFSDNQIQLSAAVTPGTEILPDLSWKSSNPKIATVDSNTGLVKFLTVGNVIITATAKNNSDLQGMSNITIIKTASGLKLDSNSKVIYVGEKLKLGYTFTPPDVANQNVKWKSSSPSVATVDDKGNITGVAVGETVIIAQAEDGNWVDTCTVSVKQMAKGIKIETKDVTLNKGDTYDIKYTIDPPNATDITLNWATNKASIATVSNTGRITAVGVGSCIITVTTSAGEVSYCNVTVIENASGIKLNFTEKTVYVNNSFTLRATIVPDGATNRKVTFSSSNSKIATVSTKGVVKGLKAGTAIITCSSEDGGYEARCIVTVKKLVTKVKLNYSSYILGLNKSLQLKATVTSNSATKKKVKWTSTSPGIAYVNSKGLVTGRKIGTATITAHSMDGSGIVARCKIKVVNPTSSIKLDKRNITMITGRTTTLKATVYPSNATYKTVKWSSSNPEVVAVEYDGRLTALKPGNATIEAKSKDSGGAKKAYCVVIVKDEMPATSVIITTKNPTMVQGQSITMRRSIVPPLSTDRVTWSSDNTMILSVDMTTGKVTARSAGTATITAITDSGKMDSTTVSVVGLSQSSITMEQYSQQTLFVEGATGVVRWTVANPNIAIVNNGVIESRKPGKTTVFATVNGIRLSCSVTVTEIGN